MLDYEDFHVGLLRLSSGFRLYDVVLQTKINVVLRRLLFWITTLVMVLTTIIMLDYEGFHVGLLMLSSWHSSFMMLLYKQNLM